MPDTERDELVVALQGRVILIRLVLHHDTVHDTLVRRLDHLLGREGYERDVRLKFLEILNSSRIDNRIATAARKGRKQEVETRCTRVRVRIPHHEFAIDGCVQNGRNRRFTVFRAEHIPCLL